MTHRFLAFDIEVAASLEDFSQWRDHRPLGITCAAMAWRQGDGEIITRAYCDTLPDGAFAPRMGRDVCAMLVAKMLRAMENGFTILTHNGLGFDFDVLAEESGMHDECVRLAMNHVDTCFHVCAVKGYPVSLSAAAQGMKLAGKLEGVAGADAPSLWAEGRCEEVLKYVEQDARTTLEVALAAQKELCLRWISRAGKVQHLMLPQWLTVAEALRLPLPDTSWMTKPIDREEFTEWMERVAL